VTGAGPQVDVPRAVGAEAGELEQLARLEARRATVGGQPGQSADGHGEGPRALEVELALEHGRLQLLDQPPEFYDRLLRLLPLRHATVEDEGAFGPRSDLGRAGSGGVKGQGEESARTDAEPTKRLRSTWT
jgi:hypothetical protein